jgi:diketogulonate reductase-like aldo/keto reductase
MILKELGRTGVLIPEVGIGTWNHHAGAHPLRCALEAGALFLDTAESYGTEEVVREAVKGLRDRVLIATKVSPQNYRRTDLRKSVDASISRLGIETIDLLQLHHPNPAISIQETMGAMSELVDAGKVRFIGVSNFSLVQLQEAQTALTKHSIVSNQVRYNLIDRTIEKGLLQYCQANGITVIAYSPLARGLSRITDCDPDGAIPALARITGKSCAQIVLNWCLCKDRVAVIPGANSEQHVLENCGASDWRMTAEQVSQLDAKIQFRHRTGLDALLRRNMPRSLERTAVAI